MTCDGSPTAIFGWACKIPSKTHSRPKPMRSSCRQAGSAAAGAEAAASAPAAAEAAPAGAAVSQARMLTQLSPTNTKMSRAIRP